PLHPSGRQHLAVSDGAGGLGGIHWFGVPALVDHSRVDIDRYRARRLVLAPASVEDGSMTAQRVLNGSGLPAYDISEQAPLWWGQLGLAVIEATMFAILIATYFYLRLSFDVWPPPGVQLPLYLPTVALVPLLLSVIGSWW